MLDEEIRKSLQRCRLFCFGRRTFYRTARRAHSRYSSRMNTQSQHRPNNRADLAQIAKQAMIDRGLEPEFSIAVEQEMAAISAPSHETGGGIRDLTALLWCSIDNDDSRDLDQLSVSESLPNGAIKILVAIADVDTLVKKGTAIDDHAHNNTCSVYTAARIFPMLPERLSTDLTSLNEHEKRLTMVTEMVFDAKGDMTSSTAYRALVLNRAKLAYDSVAAWLEGQGELPAAAHAVPGMDAQIRAQDVVAQKLRAKRREQGALEFETIQAKAVFEGDQVVDLNVQAHNRARQLIEEFMIATNQASAHFLTGKGFASLHRVVRSPERWMRIVDVATALGEALPTEPDSKALEAFLVRRRAADPTRFPDLSLTIVKLMGAGEYVIDKPGSTGAGHFGLAVRDYAHSTAPNRRFPDLVTLRLMKAALIGAASPYTDAELAALATHCSQQEDDANKVERQVRKAAAALLLASRVGDCFDAIVTGASDKGTYVRVFSPPVEGRLLQGFEGYKVGRKLRVELLGVNVPRGFIDFARRD
jgi:exoribonuclease II